MPTLPLKYLFTATFEDGTVIEQTAEDKSALEPEKRSAFFDVLQKEKESPLLTFSLTGAGHTYSVDLTTGNFKVDDTEKPVQVEPIRGPHRIIFWRGHTHVIRVIDAQELSHDVAYNFGWQAITETGKSIKRVMTLT